MKQIKLLMWAGLSSAFMYGCSENPADMNFDGGRIPVEVGVSPLSGHEIATRAGKGPMNGWYNTEVYMAYAESPAAVNPVFDRAKRGVVVAGKTSFQPQLFYPGGNTIFLRGFHPREQTTNLGANLEITANKINYTITGKEDIMISNVVSGSEGNTLKSQNAFLHYEHMLSMLSFTMKAEVGFPNTMRVKFIRIKNVSVEAVLDLDHTKTYSDTGVLTFTDAPTSELIAYQNTYGLALTTTASTESSYVMFGPGEHFDIEVEFTNNDKVLVTEIKRAGDGADISAGLTERGKHYTVGLTFKVTGITPTLTATWNTGNIGIEGNWW